MASFSYLTPKNIFRKYQDAKLFTRELTQPFPEFQRIARNRPFEGIDSAYPKTTDGTTASIIRKTPRRIIQQLPTGTVVTDDDGWLGIVAQFIYNERILPYANEEYNLIQKCWNIIEGGLTFGAVCTYAPFLDHDGSFSTDLVVPYWGDVFIPRGKKSGYACRHTFIRSWWQKSDILELIDKENKRAKSKSYEATWDTKALQQVADELGTKDKQGTAPFEKDRGIPAEGIELITGFQTGVGASFYTFSAGTNTIVRTKVNKDPRGKMPLDWMYGDIDGTNPMGRGIVELVGGLQNLIDSDMQMYQYNRALMLAPPVIKYGNIGDFKYAPNEVIDASNDPTAKIIPLTIDNSAVINYPALYGLQKSQLLNLVNSPDTSISSDVGNPSFSKTSAGVHQQQATISVDDNYVGKMFETWFEHWSETAINLYFAERTGKEELQLDKKTAMQLRELEGFDLSLLNDKNQILINYDTETEALQFRVDPNTTSVKDSAAQVADATQLLDLVMRYPMLNASFGGAIDTDVLARRIVVNSGIDDPEQVAPEPTAAQKQAKEQAKNSISPFSPMFDKPSISIKYPDLPPAAQVQLLANAGVQVGIKDVMAGPVLDPNLRGVMNPADDPYELLPGQQPGQPASQSSPTQAPATDAATAQASQVQPQQQMQPQIPAQIPAQPQQMPAQSHPLDPQLVQKLQQLGFPANVIAQAIDMLNKGASEQQVLQALGINNG